jgi:hypothetical protein
MRLLPFWAKGSAEWFTLAEAQFSLDGITEERTKFYYVLSQPDHHYAMEVQDILTSLLQQDPYTKLKTELVNRLFPSRERRARQLFTFEEMGDRKPSQFLIHSGTSPLTCRTTYCVLSGPVCYHLTSKSRLMICPRLS